MTVPRVAPVPLSMAEADADAERGERNHSSSKSENRFLVGVAPRLDPSPSKLTGRYSCTVTLVTVIPSPCGIPAATLPTVGVGLGERPSGGNGVVRPGSVELKSRVTTGVGVGLRSTGATVGESRRCFFDLSLVTCPGFLRSFDGVTGFSCVMGVKGFSLGPMACER